MRSKYFRISLIFMALSILTNPATMTLYLPVAFYIFKKENKIVSKKILVFIILTVLPAVLFYTYSFVYIYSASSNFTVGIWKPGDKWGNLNIITTFKFYNDVFLKNIAERHLLYPIFMLFIPGLFVRYNDEQKLIKFWVLSIFIYIVIVAKGNQIHEYYQLLFIPSSIIIASVLIYRIFYEYNYKFPKIITTILLLTIPFLSGARYYETCLKRETLDDPVFKAATIINSFVEEKEKIVVLSDGTPLLLYVSNRKGWVVNYNYFSTEELKRLKKDRANYLATVIYDSMVYENIKNVLNKEKELYDDKLILLYKLD